MADYKGIYYNDDNKQRYFEGGAHFKYNQLYRLLEKISSAQKVKLKREQLVKKGAFKKAEKNKIKKSQEEIKKFNNNLSCVSIFIINIYFILFFSKQKIKIIIVIIR